MKTRFAVFLYHGVADVNRFGYISPNSFRTQLLALMHSGYRIFDSSKLDNLSVDEALKFVLLTFDDGHKSNLQAAEILSALGISATFFFVKGASQAGGRYVNEPEIRRIAEHFPVGSHSMSHKPMTRLLQEELRNELGDSKAWLEDVTGCEVSSLSAPGGYLNHRVVQEALDVGYRWVFGSQKWWNSPSKVCRYRVVNRVAIDRTVATSRLMKLAACESAAYFWLQTCSLPMMLFKRFAPQRSVRVVTRAYRRYRNSRMESHR